jgi:anhydro-N-acetylmuramic acid kinase
MSTCGARYVGLMTGTSMDAVDAVLTTFTPRSPTAAGLVAAEIVATASHPLPTALRQALLAVNRDSPIGLVSALDAQLGALYGEAVNRLLKTAPRAAEAVAAIGCHGQTVLHLPDAQWPRSLQLGDPNRIAEITGITTVADFRRRDIAAGGQGAPLAPGFHHALFADRQETRVIVNIGGMANLTVLPAGAPAASFGFDTGPGNVLMDLWCQRWRGTDYDDQGAWAASAEPDLALLDDFLSDAWFTLPPPKSTGRDHFNADWLSARLLRHPQRPAAVVQATLCELTARSIASSITMLAPDTARILICGGGARNRQLFARISAGTGTRPIGKTDTCGVGADWVEAVGFAWLASARLAGRAAGNPGTTGARHATVLGGVYPGRLQARD